MIISIIKPAVRAINATKMSNKMTISEAIKEGYTHYAEESCFEGNGGSVYSLSAVHNTDLKSYPFVLCEKNTMDYQISDGLLYDLLSDHLECQEEVNDERGELIKLIADVDFGHITEIINEKLSKNKYYKSTNIQLVPDEQK